MKKKLLSFLLFPLILTSCATSPLNLSQMREKVAGLSDEALYPYYKVVGSADFNNIVTEVDADFTREPSTETFVPYARYNDGFYNATADMSEADPNDIVIYALGSKSYWMRAPLRISKSNFYQEVITISRSTVNGSAVNVNQENGKIGTVDLYSKNKQQQTFSDVRIVNPTAQGMTLLVTYQEGEQVVQDEMSFERVGEMDADLPLAGKYKDAYGNVIEIIKGTRENTTCAHYLIEHIITSYIGQTGSTNPSKNIMKMNVTSDGHFVFYGEAVHTTLYLDNLPYYPDPDEHPEVGEWDPDLAPIPCFKNKINAKVNIKFEYNQDGWLIKEEFATIDYNYKVASCSQAAAVAYYGYRFN